MIEYLGDWELLMLSLLCNDIGWAWIGLGPLLQLPHGVNFPIKYLVLLFLFIDGLAALDEMLNPDIITCYFIDLNFLLQIKQLSS